MRRQSAVRKVFGDLYREFSGEGMPSATVRAYSERWLEQKRPETAESSHLAYTKTISVFLHFLAERAERDLADSTRGDIMRFRNELANRLGADTVALLGRKKVVVPSTEREIEPLDGSTQVGPQRLNLEMVMIAHQDVGMDSLAKACRHPGEQLPEMLLRLYCPETTAGRRFHDS